MSERVFMYRKRHVLWRGEYNGYGPDAPWIVRWMMHWLTLAIWHATPSAWWHTTGWRHRAWMVSVELLAWWNTSHEQEPCPDGLVPAESEGAF